MVGRTGARNLQFGFYHDPPIPGVPNWWAFAQYKGARIMAEHQQSPLLALQALVERLLLGAHCKCGRVVTLYEHWARVGNAELLHGRGFWSAQAQARAGSCQWTRRGDRWESSCDAEPIPIESR